MYHQTGLGIMTLDKQTRDAIAVSVKKAVMEANEVYDEVWLTGKQLGEQVGFFTKEWLKRYGTSLPREALKVKDENGVVHRTGWCYPKKKILRMIAEGEMRNLVVMDRDVEE